ncbi:hypothetical protein B0H16DRAFT_523175 [Mycena metata]|uniref:Uncharacterized protein n=1 Tax=Mycena metata TaxID=1033252 RepID=A0AAD7H941_9AGAR|nr:hypothetical protein B0H16DRAFT_523175 [Mycena metata]
MPGRTGEYLNSRGHMQKNQQPHSPFVYRTLHPSSLSSLPCGALSCSSSSPSRILPITSMRAERRWSGGSVHGRLGRALVRYCREELVVVSSAASRVHRQAAGVVVMVVPACSIEALVLVVAPLARLFSPATRLAGTCPAHGRSICAHGGRCGGVDSLGLQMGCTSASDLFLLSPIRRPPRIPPKRNTTNFKTICDTTVHRSTPSRGFAKPLPEAYCTRLDFNPPSLAQGHNSSRRASHDTTEPTVKGKPMTGHAH